MLDITTKRRIDDCRDILVGKLPDPKAQIEQITIALIYKFMDDMDKEAVELGGSAKFFSGEYAKYSWDALFSSKVTSAEMLRLYSEAIESMEKNPNIPQLFRDIFNNAYLPYRDPETLKLFLKTIGEFEYTHSEKLGDAFEYLLSVMGSQGDAGQFRTPRHIIDFLVELVDPKKSDTILDPACGTAGFLISAFKYIKEQNNGQLTPDEHKRMIRNLVGYDISPDMVRLSLVNLYLHGFTDPHITEYDTLSSEERWDERFDVILANPPFMTPKGGIRPHKKFTVKSNRSEVLFVDYIAEHLNPNGRAGIIVPEGVIFQTGTAYKELRKMLVNDYLYAVVSLPAGVFNPYSGVKTSILLMDKALAKKSKQILFVKIDNDGYNLGAQRTAVKGSQLGEAIDLVHEFVRTGSSPQNTLAHVVPKTVLAKNGDYSLSGERYKKVTSVSSTYETIPCGDLMRTDVKSFDPRTKAEDKYELWSIPAYDLGKPEIIYGHEIGSAKKIVTPGDVLLSKIVPHIRRSWVVDGRNENILKIASTEWIVFNSDKVIPHFLQRILTSDPFHNQFMMTLTGVGGSLTRANPKAVSEILIPLPPLNIQEEIVAEIQRYQKVIDGAKMVVDSYKPQIVMDPEWEMVELGKVCSIDPKKSEVSSLPADMPVSFVPMADLNENQIDFVPKQIKPLGEVIKGYTYFKEDDVLLAKVTPCFENGKAGIAKGLVNGIGFGSSEYYVIRPNENILSTWIYLNIITDEFRKQGKLNMTGTGGLQRVPRDFVAATLIPLPPVEVQHQLISKIEKELELVNANKELIQILEQKIKDRIARVWGEKSPAEEVLTTAAEPMLA